MKHARAHALRLSCSHSGVHKPRRLQMQHLRRRFCSMAASQLMHIACVCRCGISACVAGSPPGTNNCKAVSVRLLGIAMAAQRVAPGVDECLSLLRDANGVFPARGRVDTAHAHWRASPLARRRAARHDALVSAGLNSASRLQKRRAALRSRARGAAIRGGRQNRTAWL